MSLKNLKHAAREELKVASGGCADRWMSKMSAQGDAAPRSIVSESIAVAPGSATTDHRLVDGLGAPWVMTDIVVELLEPPTAGRFTVEIGLTPGADEFMATQTFDDTDVAGDTRGVLVAELGTTLVAGTNYRALLASTANVVAQIITVGATGTPKVAIHIVGFPLTPLPA